jgi:hypothetical protein
MKGSWAGAMGPHAVHPTSFESLAVDFTGDGRRDIWGEDPSDALASTANYLAKSGWRQGEPWGELADEGGSGGRIITPSGSPAFRVFHNFDVIKRYNNADAYAITVGHLSDRLRGRPPLRGFFSQERPLTQAERVRLQERLTAQGFDTGRHGRHRGPAHDPGDPRVPGLARARAHGLRGALGAGGAALGRRVPPRAQPVAQAGASASAALGSGRRPSRRRGRSSTL